MKRSSSSIDLQHPHCNCTDCGSNWVLYSSTSGSLILVLLFWLHRPDRRSRQRSVIDNQSERWKAAWFIEGLRWVDPGSQMEAQRSSVQRTAVNAVLTCTSAWKRFACVVTSGFWCRLRRLSGRLALICRQLLSLCVKLKSSPGSNPHRALSLINRLQQEKRWRYINNKI